MEKCQKNYNVLRPKNTFINMQTVQEVMGNDIQQQKKIMILSGISCDFGEQFLQISYLTSHSVHGYTSLLLTRYMMSSFAFCMNMCLYKPILLSDVIFEQFLSKWTVPSIYIGKVTWERGYVLGQGAR